MVVWFVARLWCLPQMIYFKFTVCTFQDELAPLQPFMTISVTFLSILCALHAYWFSLFIKIIVHFFSKGQAEDLQNRITKESN